MSKPRFDEEEKKFLRRMQQCEATYGDRRCVLKNDGHIAHRALNMSVIWSDAGKETVSFLTRG